MLKIDSQVKSLQRAIEANSGKVPQEWETIINFIEFALKILKLFTNEKTDAVIDEILKAIEDFKRSRK